MNLLDKITLALISAPLTEADPIQELAGKITNILGAVLSALGGLAIMILGFRLIKDIVLSKKEDNPEEEVAKYKKRISNTIIALVIVAVVLVVSTSTIFTVMKDWIASMLTK